MRVEATLEKDLEHRFNKLDGKRRSILSNCETYAAWTLPYVHPTGSPGATTENIELQLSKDSIGAKAVNNLANKIAMVLFPEQRLFFRLLLDSTGRKAIAAAQAQAQASGQDAQEIIKAALAKVEEELLAVEKDALEQMNYIAFTPVAVEIAKNLIITGNSLLVMHDNRPPQYFNIRDYVVVRDLSGEWIEIITKESKSYETFSPEVQEQLRTSRTIGTKSKPSYTDDSDVCVYTQIRLGDDGKFHARQQADAVELDTGRPFWPKNTVPYIPLIWNLVRGEDYGRGLVADYAGAFHAIETLTESLLNIAAVAGDIKFLVDPSSRADVELLNNSAPGSYHSGREGDISAVQTGKISDAQFIATMIDRYEKQISEAFLLNSNMVRQAERVTAEEIRMVANELEVSNGGIYSRLASTWQAPMANILLEIVGFDAEMGGVSSQVVTGMDSLSRTGELDSARMWLAEMANLNNVPEDVRAYLDIPGWMKFVGMNRQVDYTKFTRSAEAVQADREKQMQQQMQMEAQKQQGVVAAEAGRQAVKSE